MYYERVFKKDCVTYLYLDICKIQDNWNLISSKDNKRGIIYQYKGTKNIPKPSVKLCFPPNIVNRFHFSWSHFTDINSHCTIKWMFRIIGQKFWSKLLVKIWNIIVMSLDQINKFMRRKKQACAELCQSQAQLN